MTERTCLLIDDDKQDLVIPAIIEEGKRYNINIECLQFNIGNQERRDLLENEEVSISKVVSVFKSEFRGKKIDLIAIDWNLGGAPKINGPVIIKAFNDNDIRNNVPKVLYSGVLKEEIEKLCDTYRRDPTMQFKIVWAQINALISSGGVLTYVSRDDYEKGIVERLRKIEDTIEGTIEGELRNFPEFKFQNRFVSKNFQNKTFVEIAEIIEGNTHLRNEFTIEFTKQLMAFITERI